MAKSKTEIDTTMTLDEIAQVAIGTVVFEPNGGPNNEKEAWDFFNSEIQKHDKEVAVVIRRNDFECFGEILANFAAPDTFAGFKRFLEGKGFHDTGE